MRTGTSSTRTTSPRPGKTGIDEVDVDALTGKIIAVEHETPAQMKKEAAEEANEAKATATPAAKPKKP